MQLRAFLYEHTEDSDDAVRDQYVWFLPEVGHGSGSQLLKRKGECEFHGMVQGIWLDKWVSKQVQVLEAQLTEVTGQHSQLVVRRRQEPQLGESADVERQTDELVVVQFEVH